MYSLDVLQHMQPLPFHELSHDQTAMQGEMSFFPNDLNFGAFVVMYPTGIFKRLSEGQSSSFLFLLDWIDSSSFSHKPAVGEKQRPNQRCNPGPKRLPMMQYRGVGMWCHDKITSYRCSMVATQCCILHHVVASIAVALE